MIQHRPVQGSERERNSINGQAYVPLYCSGDSDECSLPPDEEAKEEEGQQVAEVNEGP